MGQIVKLILLILFVFDLSLFAGEKMNIHYDLSWQYANSHYYDVKIQIKNPEKDTTDFRIPNWRPGRYIIQNFTKNVVEFYAQDNAGDNLSFTQIDKDTWQVVNGNKTSFEVGYKVYANEFDAGNSFLDDREAYINPVTVFMYLPGWETYPVSLKIHKPDEWKIACALDFTENGNADIKDYHELVDSPIIISPDFKILTFNYDGALYQLVFQGNVKVDPKVVDDVKKIVKAEVDLMQVTPFKRYVFLYHLTPYRFSHGVEHKNSTSIVVGPADFSNDRFYNDFLSVTAHEFFHVWNVERIRPASIYLPDYSREKYTTLMWFFEGVTSYYDNIASRRCGVLPYDKFLSQLAGGISSLENNYGSKINSPSMASFESWGKSNFSPPFTYVSFYTQGSVLGFMLDLEIRHRTNNEKSLDDVMRYLYKTYAMQDKGVPEDGIQKAVDAVAGSSFKHFFSAYVDGTVEPDYNVILNYAGLQLVEKTDDDQPSVSLGIRLDGDEKETTIKAVTPQSAAMEAGLFDKDILLALDDYRVDKTNIFESLKQYVPGDTVLVTVFHHDRLKNVQVVLKKNKTKRYSVNEVDEASEKQLNIRISWIGSDKEEGEQNKSQ